MRLDKRKKKSVLLLNTHNREDEEKQELEMLFIDDHFTSSLECLRSDNQMCKDT